jgi:multiple antibiotic resistance protein
VSAVAGERDADDGTGVDGEDLGVLEPGLGCARVKMVLDDPKTGADADEPGGDISIVPLGTPLLAGPGPISSVIVFSSQGIGGHVELWMSDLVLLGLIAIAALITYLSLRAALPVGKWLGNTGINVMTRLAGILVAAIAVQMIVSGLAVALPGLK